MAPAFREIKIPSSEVLAKAQKSGVLILIYPLNKKPHIVLMKRVSYPGGIHSGQISFPGGRWEKSDRDLTETALREAEEEVGVDISSVKVLGLLSQIYIPPSNFLVQPVVGLVNYRPDFIPDSREVDQLFEVPVSWLLDPANRGKKPIVTRSNITLQAPFFDVEGHSVWGATAMMLSEFLHLAEPQHL